MPIWVDAPHVLNNTSSAIQNSKSFLDQSIDEVRLLRFVNNADPDDKHGILRLYEYFYHRVHPSTASYSVFPGVCLLSEHLPIDLNVVAASNNESDELWRPCLINVVSPHLTSLSCSKARRKSGGWWAGKVVWQQPGSPVTEFS